MENTTNSAQNTPVLSVNHRQTWTRSAHHILALKTKLKGRHVVIPQSLKTGIRTTPPKSHGNRKTKLMACQSI